LEVLLLDARVEALLEVTYVGDAVVFEQLLGEDEGVLALDLIEQCLHYLI
jgi:hypothetical protein